MIPFGGMNEIPLFPDFFLDTSREASVPFEKRLLPWRSGEAPDKHGRVWVSAFQTNSIVVRGRSRYKGRVIAALSIVKDAHRKSDRQAMEEAEESIRYRIRDSVPGNHDRGRATFSKPVEQRCRCNDLIG